MNISLDGITLPGDLVWEDRYSWSKHAHNESRGLTGSLIIEDSVKISGRHFTLAGGSNFAWISKAMMDQLKAKEQADPPVDMTLHLDGVDYTVRWRQDAVAFTASPTVPNSSKFNNVAMRFIEV